MGNLGFDTPAEELEARCKSLLVQCGIGTEHYSGIASTRRETGSVCEVVCTSSQILEEAASKSEQSESVMCRASQCGLTSRKPMKNWEPLAQIRMTKPLAQLSDKMQRMDNTQLKPRQCKITVTHFPRHLEKLCTASCAKRHRSDLGAGVQPVSCLREADDHDDAHDGARV